MLLYSENVYLRPFELHDADKVRELAGEYAIAKTTLSIPNPYPEGVAEEFIRDSHEGSARKNRYMFAIVHNLDDELLGTISLNVTTEHKRGEIGYWMGKAYWGHGYTTEAARRLLKFGFEELDLNRVYAFAFSTNPASSRVMQKIGMTYAGTLIQHVFKWDQYQDLVAYGILKSAYQELTK